MNNIILKGTLKNIKYSHSIGNVEYFSANMLVPRHDGTEDFLNIKYKKLSNPYTEGDEIELVGNVRSYSHVLNDKNKVDIYVFTYFDKPTDDEEIINKCTIDGCICKKDKLRTLKNGKCCFHFTLANSIVANGKKINSYIPCVIWGEEAKVFDFNVGDEVSIIGELHSREYVKKISDTDCEIRVAHELVVNSISNIIES